MAPDDDGTDFLIVIHVIAMNIDREHRLVLSRRRGDDEDEDQGLDELREWATTAGVTLTPGRMYVHGGIVVVEETATWASAPDRALPEALAFRVVDDQVVSVYRHPTLEHALEATRLGEEDLYEG